MSRGGQGVVEAGGGGLDAKLLAALDRVGEALRAELRRRSRTLGLTPTQARILLRLATDPPERRRVGALAAEFDLRQPTVSDAVASAERKGLVRRAADPEDARLANLALTARGRRVADALASWDAAAAGELECMPEADKADALALLLELLAGLNRAGVIATARMCTTCRFLSVRAARRHCDLLDVELRSDDLRIDCPEHQARFEVDEIGEGPGRARQRL